MKRNLSGIYFRAKNESGGWDNICFEDLSEDQQDKQMEGRNDEWVKSLAKQLAKTLKEIGDQFDLVKE